MPQPVADLLTLKQDAIIDLFVIDLSPIVTPAIDYRFTSDSYANGNAVVFQGITYQPAPIEWKDAPTESQEGSYTPPQPQISFGNVFRAITTLCAAYQDLKGAKLWRKRTCIKYLDGMPQANPNLEFLPDIFFIERKSLETKIAVVFELASAISVGLNHRLPARTIIRDRCIWKYRGADCGYTGGAKADINNNPTSNIALDDCAKDAKACHYRYPNEKPASFFLKVDKFKY